MKNTMRSVLRVAIIIAVTTVVMALFSPKASADLSVHVTYADKSHHWLSENITNEDHDMLAVGIGPIVVAKFENSYRQEGFDGKTYALGYQWRGNHIVRAADGSWEVELEFVGILGLSYGYTEFAGHKPGGSPKVHPFAAGGIFYVHDLSDTFKVKAGALQFGDATLPSIEVEKRFEWSKI